MWGESEKRLIQRILIVFWFLPATVYAQQDFNDLAARHPAGESLRRVFSNQPTTAPTGLTKKDYLSLIAGNVDFWKKFQNTDGAILDPYEKDEQHPQGQEKQYSTPAFALAAAELVKESGRDDLLDPAVRAFNFALTALVNKTTANQHADFYIPMLVHAHRILKTRVPPETSAKWEDQFKAIIPEKNYRDVGGNGNWNLVNVSGDALRRRDRLVATTQMAAQQDYLDRMLGMQQAHFTRFGMYHDANLPLAYDAFPRLWLEDMTADGAYTGPERDELEQTLALGSFSSLLLISPQGEWPCGGRSAQHQWNEAENAVIGEINAARWKAAGRDDLAGAFKRMARMCLKSMKRWQRPSGEMWIVKNFAEPQSRFGFEGYSFNSQYNLLPMAMLAIAYERADESIEEKPLPSEYATYVFDLRDPFTKVVAAAGGYYVLIDTNADPHYNATGLQRIHRAGVELSPLTDSAAAERAYTGMKDDPRVALTPGIQWKDGNDWIGLADFHRFEPPSKPAPDQPAPQRVVKETRLSMISGAAPDEAAFWIKYDLVGPGAKPIHCHYRISKDGVTCEDSGAWGRWVFPVMVNDGARDTQVKIERGKLHVQRAGGALTLRLEGATFQLVEPRIPTHNGYIKRAIVDLPQEPLPQGTIGAIHWQVTLEPAPLTTVP